MVGLGSKHSPIDDISTRMVYAMKVTQVLSMKEYDDFCRARLPEKIPEWSSLEFPRKMGDCIYDFGSSAQPILRRSIHNEENRKTDLGGENVLLSQDFHYFGDKPIELPKKLHALIHSTQGHKSKANDPYLEDFQEWLAGLDRERNVLLGEPQLKQKILSMAEEGCRTFCSKQHLEEDERDSIC